MRDPQLPAFLSEHRTLSRRYFLQRGLAGAAALTAVPLLAAEDSRDPALQQALEKLEAWLTKPDEFRDVSRGKPVPHSLDEDRRTEVGLTRDTWQLEVLPDPEHPARIRNPLTKEKGNAFNFSDLMQLAETRAVRFAKVMTCLNLGCPLGNGIWEGVPLRDVLWLTRPSQNLRRVFYYGYHNDDPQQMFRSSLPVGRILEDLYGLPPVILCYKLNGQWLTPERGAPVRIVVPEAYGFKNIKWLSHVFLSNQWFANDTYGEKNNDVDSPLKTFCETLSYPASVKPEQPIAITGYAQAGVSGLKKVQVWIQPDGEELPAEDRYYATAPWQDAEILPPPENWGGGLPGNRVPLPAWGFDDKTGQPKTWPMRLTKAHWAVLLPGLPAGKYTLRCRTIDENGIAQPLPRPFRKSGRAAIQEVGLRVEAQPATVPVSTRTPIAMASGSFKPFSSYQMTQENQMPIREMRTFVVMLSLLCIAGVCRSAEPPRYTAHRAESPIMIDGRLDEAAWRNAPAFGDFQFPWWKAGKKEQTVARMLWDDRFVYVAFQCADGHISATRTERDSKVYRDDCVEVFVAPNPRRPVDYFNIEMNVNGAILDRHHPAGPGKPQVPNWNASGIRIATSVDGTLNDDTDTDRGWILEVAIPFANFADVTGKPHPADGDVWHLNLNRLGGETNPQHSQWSPGNTEKPAFHTPDTFGRVTFSSRTAPEQTLLSLAAAGYEPVPGFLRLPDDVELGRCSAVALGSQDELYLYHRGKQPVLCFTAEGEFVRSWGDDLVGMAHGLRVDADGNIWATDIARHVVFKFSPRGKLLLTLGTLDSPGTESHQFNKPADVAFGPNGDVYVADGYGNSRVVKFNRQGKYLAAWGTPGSRPGQFSLPHAIVIDAQQRVLVGDRENDRIQVFDLGGKLLDVWNGFAPYGIAIDSAQQVFVADARAVRILRLGADGTVKQRLGGPGHAPGQFELPHMLANVRDGSLYVAEVGGERFQKFRRLKK